ncbi:hypothetical protein LUZ60_011390 [Juncus effusus]|nr:hypothetical protein LUZ60_011390 [Juncus effusus]
MISSSLCLSLATKVSLSNHRNPPNHRLPPSMAVMVTAATDAWSSAVTWLGLVVRMMLQVLSGTYCAWAPQFLLPSFFFKPLRSDQEMEIPIVASAAPPLPASSLESLDKLTVVLDLDETLVCAYETCSLTDFVRCQATQAGLNSFEIQFLSSHKEIDGKPKMNHVTVFERPGLDEFLQEVSKFADLVLFTAGLEGYARPLVDKIDVENRFKLRLYRPATTSTEYREHVKDLTCLSKDLSRIVIVDNNPFSFLLQPLNGIPCIPFTPAQPSDDQLLSVLLPLLKELSQHRDVRPLLNCIFQMPDWFQKHGIPQSRSPSSV